MISAQQSVTFGSSREKSEEKKKRFFLKIWGLS